MHQSNDLELPLSIVVPLHNESKNIQAFYQEAINAFTALRTQSGGDYESDFPNIEIVFVNDGSTDDTLEVIKELIINHPRIKLRVVSNLERQGVQESWLTGLMSAEKKYVMFWDGDLQYDPASIPTFIHTFHHSSADILQGSRIRIGRAKNWESRNAEFLTKILNFIFRVRKKDITSGLILGEKNSLIDVLSNNRFKYRNFSAFTCVVAQIKGFEVLQADVNFKNRIEGDSNFGRFWGIVSVIQVLFEIPKLMLDQGLSKTFRIGKIPLRSTKLPKWSLKYRFRFWLFWKTCVLHKWIISNRAKHCYLWLKETEYLNIDVLEKLSEERLRKLLLHANSKVPYYTKLFRDKNVNLNKLSETSILKHIPLLTKADVRSNIHDSMISIDADINRLHRISTSGSTGEPFVCYADQFQLEMRWATTFRALEMTGWTFGQKSMRLWHQTLGMSRTQVLREKMDAWFMRRKFVPAFEFTEEKVNSLLESIDNWKPFLLDGYAESLNFISSPGFKSIVWSPKAVMSSAQQLTVQTRNNIEGKFKTKLFDKYGSREFSGIAYQCNFGSYHVQSESYIVEILVDGRSAEPGEIGEIVVTDLNNLSVPLIRYMIGDLAREIVQKKCKCGRSSRQIGEIVGRTQALVACQNGVWLPGTFFAHFFKEYDFAIKQFQVIQKEVSSFQVLVVPTPQFSNQAWQAILNDLSEYIGQTNVNLEIVSEIPLLKTGKRTPVVSELSEVKLQNFDKVVTWNQVEKQL